MPEHTYTIIHRSWFQTETCKVKLRFKNVHRCPLHIMFKRKRALFGHAFEIRQSLGIVNRTKNVREKIFISTAGRQDNIELRRKNDLQKMWSACFKAAVKQNTTRWSSPFTCCTKLCVLQETSEKKVYNSASEVTTLWRYTNMLIIIIIIIKHSDVRQLCLLWHLSCLHRCQRVCTEQRRMSLASHMQKHCRQ